MGQNSKKVAKIKKTNFPTESIYALIWIAHELVFLWAVLFQCSDALLECNDVIKLGWLTFAENIPGYLGFEYYVIII